MKNGVENIRTWNPTASDAKNVDDTNMLNTTARETPDTVKSTNTNKEDTNSHPAFGDLGAKGRH